MAFKKHFLAAHGLEKTTSGALEPADQPAGQTQSLAVHHFLRPKTGRWTLALCALIGDADSDLKPWRSRPRIPHALGLTTAGWANQAEAGRAAL